MDETEISFAIIGIVVEIGVILTAFIILFYQKYLQMRKERKERLFIPKILSFNIYKAIKRHSEYSEALLRHYCRKLPRIGLIMIKNRFVTYNGNWVEFMTTAEGVKPSSRDANVIIEDVRDFIKVQYDLDLDKVLHWNKEI